MYGIARLIVQATKMGLAKPRAVVRKLLYANALSLLMVAATGINRGSEMGSARRLHGLITLAGEVNLERLGKME